MFIPHIVGRNHYSPTFSHIVGRDHYLKVSPHILRRDHFLLLFLTSYDTTTTRYFSSHFMTQPLLRVFCFLGFCFLGFGFSAFLVSAFWVFCFLGLVGERQLCQLSKHASVGNVVRYTLLQWKDFNVNKKVFIEICFC